MKYRPRSIFLLALVIVAAIALPSFLNHYLYFITGQVKEAVIRQRWDFVFLNILAFLLFLIPLNYRRKADWKSMGVYTAFIVSLFIEMYGIPLTVYLSSSFLSSTGTPPNALFAFTFLNQNFAMNLWMIVGLAITLNGMILVAIGWITIYRNRDGFVNTGIYGYSRHPQYLGIILIAIGWFIGWPTILTTLILPILIYFYYRVSKAEEEEVANELGEEKYQEYREKAPMFI